MTVILGPILGFRGLQDGAWRTCALVVQPGRGGVRVFARAAGSRAIVHPPPPGLIVYAMEKVMTDNVEEVDRGITARMMKFPFSAQHFIAKRNWLSLELDEESRVWAKWHVEGEKEPLHQGRPPDRREVTNTEP